MRQRSMKYGEFQKIVVIFPNKANPTRKIKF